MSFLSVPELLQRAAVLLPQIAEGAAERERTRQLPHEQIRQLAAARLLTLRIPQRYGGSESSVREVVLFVIDLAAVDSNIAQSLRPSFAFIESLLVQKSEAERQLWFAHYLQGEVFGNAGWEIGGANGQVSARIVPQGEHFRANGSKYYSTGALYADWVSAVALDENDEPVSFVVPRDREGLELVDDFDAMGQRLTASGTTRLNNVLVRREEIRTRVVEAPPTSNSSSPALSADSAAMYWAWATSMAARVTASWLNSSALAASRVSAARNTTASAANARAEISPTENST